MTSVIRAFPICFLRSIQKLGAVIGKEIAYGSLRLSLDDVNTEAEVDYVLAQLTAIVATLRSMSPVWEALTKKEAV